MKNRIYIFSLVLLISLYSCKKGVESKKSEHNFKAKIDTVELKKEAIATIERDSTLKPQKVDFILAYSEIQTDTLIGFCNCEKNVKNNTLKIQIRTEFPALSELQKGNRNATEFQMGVSRQYRFLTFYLRDSIVEKAKIYKASTEQQFENKKIDSTSIENYKIKINRFDYKIAQNVWGNYELELPNPFGFIENDFKVKGTFHCNNWKIVEYEELPEWTIKGNNYIE
ncbi:hypothetical protein DWB61_17245 [Ancylomarina euxinus]|uniref:Lipoprotein n=1 Tax=Ancylomarina euxinus TaxID=2283627 RepID=A0A425XWK6_9BACT|nr:hypothetical protein [Ancylomarina euxinus]MCZ4696396.1 hypothetical protein [Ancylomarina euxinus]RRG19026.1 hypothetical protein DWB61_17245 [Ancylomarina euxinus]